MASEVNGSGSGNPIVFFDMTIGGKYTRTTDMTSSRLTIVSSGEPLGRIKMELFADVTPKTAENFRQFCTGEARNQQGQAIGYKGCKFHRVVRVVVFLQSSVVLSMLRLCVFFGGIMYSCMWGICYVSIFLSFISLNSVCT